MDVQKFDLLHDQVIAWGTERNLFDPENGTTAKRQFLKLVEEFGELAGGMARNKPEMVKDAIGDMIVVCLGMMKLVQVEPKLVRVNIKPQSIFNDDPIDKVQGMMFDMFHLCFTSSDMSTLNVIINTLLDLERDGMYNFCDCLEHAYNEIKDRKGKMINGVFVKEADLIG